MWLLARVSQEFPEFKTWREVTVCIIRLHLFLMLHVLLDIVNQTLVTQWSQCRKYIKKPETVLGEIHLISV